MSKTYVEIEVSYKSEEGRNYKIPVTVHLSHESDYGADYDGNRGESRYFLDDIKLACSDDDLRAMMNEEDYHGFDLDFVSEDAFELALDSLASEY